MPLRTIPHPTSMSPTRRGCLWRTAGREKALMSMVAIVPIYARRARRSGGHWVVDNGAAYGTATAMRARMRCLLFVFLAILACTAACAPPYYIANNASAALDCPEESVTVRRIAPETHLRNHVYVAS